MARPADDEFERILFRHLPNGLHDGRLRQLRVDLDKRILSLECDADMSDPDAGEYAIRYERHMIYVEGLWAFECECVAGLNQLSGDKLRVDCGTLDDGMRSKVGWGQLPDDTFGCWLFLAGANAFLHFAGSALRVEGVHGEPV